MIKLFDSILIDKSASVKDAMKQLDKTAEKILFVVDGNNKLIGSLTDGDIRRWVLRDGSLNESISEVCFKDTFSVGQNYDINTVKQEILKLRISHVPIVDKENKVVEFLAWDKLFKGKIIRKVNEKLDVEVVIMAGGKGSRLDPFTRILPKPLIPIGDKTILEIIFDKFLDNQINHFYLSINHKAKLIKSYFEELNPEYSISYLYEEKPLGTVGAIKQLEGKIKKDIILTNCDIIVNTDYHDLVKHHKRENNDITIVASLKHYIIPYGICEIENGGKLITIREKPEYDLFVNAGMYILNPQILKYIPNNEFFHMTHLIEKIKKTHKVGIYPISEKSWLDTGEWVEYKKAVEKLRL